MNVPSMKESTPSTSEDPVAALHRFAAGLAARDWVQWEGFLGAARIEALRDEATGLQALGRFRPAGLGLAGELDARVRGDEILWLEPEFAPVASRLLRGELDAVRAALNQVTYLGLHEFEGHYAVYPAGAAYERHLDKFRDNNRRVVSLVLYLNRDWSAEQGGELRLYPSDTEPVTVQPRGGTLVCFLSERVPHEVLPARRARLSLTGWFRRRT